MKRVLVFLLVVVLSSCTGDDNSRINNQIIGEWKLMKAEIVSFSQNPSIIDYSDENIIYNFKSEGKLVITGEVNVGYLEGEYDYYFGDDYLGGTSGSKSLLVKINTAKWTYNLTNGEMKLGQSYVDGPDLFLKRK